LAALRDKARYTGILGTLETASTLALPPRLHGVKASSTVRLMTLTEALDCR